MKVEVKCEKTDWNNPEYTLILDGEVPKCKRSGSNTLVKATNPFGRGVFTEDEEIVSFIRGNTRVEVNFGTPWDISAYENPALEIARRVSLVNAAFEAVKENYTSTWTVEI